MTCVNKHIYKVLKSQNYFMNNDTLTFQFCCQGIFILHRIFLLIPFKSFTLIIET